MEDMMKQQTDCYPPHYTIPRRGKAKPPGGVLVGDVTDQHKSFYKRADPHHNLSMVHFEKQPPDNTRKTFFHFVISLFDQNHQAVEVLKASFKDFCDTTENGQEYRNGLIYKLYVSYSDGVQKEEELHIRLIDSSTKQLIPYEGTCKSPDFRRVLLTHEVICSRCLEHRSCGNKKETPSDPILIDRYRLKFFVKCNQNCLKNAGNPKDSRRRFEVAVYIPPNSDTPIGCSDAMFVHNNCKHGQKANPVREAMVGDGKPYIISVHPHEGCMTGGSSVCIIGMNFYEGTEVVFGTLPAASELISPCAIAVKTPPSPRSGEVDITLVYQGSQYCIKKFVYLAPDEAHFEHNFARLERLLRNPEEPDDIPKDNLLKRAADALETFYSLPWPNYSGGGDAGPLTHGNQPVGSGQYFFSFPTTQADAKIEHMSSIHKPKPVTPGGVYPVAKVAHMPQGMYGYPSSSGDMNGFMANNMGEHHESNRNNNNSNIGFGHPMVAAGWHGNPIHLIPPSPPTAPVQASGYHLGQLPGTTTTSSLQHLAHIPAQSYYIGANTPCNAGQHQASFQSRQHLQGLAYGQVVAAGGSPQDYTSPLATTTTSALTSYNVGYGHLTTTSSYTQPAGNLSLMPPSVAPPHLLIPHQLPMTRTL